MNELPWISVEEELPVLGHTVYVVLDYPKDGPDDLKQHQFITRRHRVLEQKKSPPWMWSEGTRPNQVTHWCMQKDILPS